MRTSCKGLVLHAHTLLPLSSIKQNIVCSVQQSFIYLVSRTQLPLLHTAETFVQYVAVEAKKLASY